MQGQCVTIKFQNKTMMHREQPSKTPDQGSEGRPEVQVLVSLSVHWQLSVTRLWFCHTFLHQCLWTDSFPRRGHCTTNTFSFGNPRWPLNVWLLQTSVYCCVVSVVGKHGHFDPPRSSIWRLKVIFFLYGRVRTNQNPPSVIRSDWYKCVKPHHPSSGPLLV